MVIPPKRVDTTSPACAASAYTPGGVFLVHFCRGHFGLRSVEFAKPRLDLFAYLSQQLSEVVLVVKPGQDAAAGVEQFKQLVDLGIPGQYHCVIVPPSRATKRTG